MRTCINGKEASWPFEVQAKWEGTAHIRSLGTIVDANYFTPRPYVDEWNRGSRDEGFTYTVHPPGSAGVPQVWQIVLDKEGH